MQMILSERSYVQSQLLPIRWQGSDSRAVPDCLLKRNSNPASVNEAEFVRSFPFLSRKDFSPLLFSHYFRQTSVFLVGCSALSL